jgi:hypothetical protein
MKKRGAKKLQRTLTRKEIVFIVAITFLISFVLLGFIFDNFSSKFNSSSGNSEEVLTGEQPSFSPTRAPNQQNQQNQPKDLFRPTVPIHISYFAEENSAVRYAKRELNGNWNIKVIDEGVFGTNDIEVDSQGKVYIAYNVFSGGVKYVKVAHEVGAGGNCGYNSGVLVGDWQCEAIDVGNFGDLFIGDNDVPVISYLVTFSDAKYASYVGSGGNCGNRLWNCEDVTSVSTSNIYPDPPEFIDEEIMIFRGNPNPGNTGMYVAYRNVGSGGTGGCANGWDCDLMVTGGGVDISTSNKYFESFSYYGGSWSSIGLKYVKKVGSGGNCVIDELTGQVNPEWQCDRVVPIQAQSETSLEYDDSSSPVISYYNGYNYDLKIAEYVGGSSTCGPGGALGWKCTAIDKQGTVGTGTSLALDPNIPKSRYISYIHNLAGNLKFARYVGSGGNCGYDSGALIGDWQCSTIDILNHYWDYSTSIAVG